jgi:tetratricopeptide (TPR) repeat protein
MRESSILQRGKDLWGRLENGHISFQSYLILFFSIVTIRNLLESFSSTGYIEQFGTYSLHYPLAFTIAILMLTILLSALSTERIEKVSRLMLYLWLLVLMPPLVDLLLVTAQTGERKAIGWLRYEPGSFWWTFLNFYNPFVKLQGATFGIRAESFLSCALAAVYVFVKSRSVWRTILTPFVISFFSFCFFSLPILFVSLSSLLNPRVVDVESMIFAEENLFRNMTQVVATTVAVNQLFLALFLVLIWLLLYDRRRLHATLASFDWGAYGFSLLCAALGFILGWRMFLPSMSIMDVAGNHKDISAMKAAALVLWGVTLFGSSLARRGRQNEAEQQAGSRGRAHDPGPAPACPGLQSGNFDPGPAPAFEPGDVLIVSLLVAVPFAAVTSYPVLVWTLVLLALETVCHVAPFRACAIPLPGATARAFGSFVSCMLGYSLFAGNLAPSLFPGKVAVFLLIFFFAAHLLSSHRRMRPLLAGSLAAASFVAIAFILWPRMPELGGTVRHTPRELRHSVFATFLEHDGLEDHSLLELEKAYDLGSRDPWVALTLGDASVRRGDREEALAYSRRALELDPGNVEALNRIVMLLSEMGRDEEAREYARRLFAADDESGLSFTNAATFYISRGQAEEGLRQLLAGGRLPQSEAGREAVLRLVLATIEEASPAETGARSGNARAQSRDVVDQVKAGASFQKAGRLGEALASYKEALDVEPLLAGLRFVSGSVCQAMGDHESAAREYRLFLSVYPGHLEGSINLGASLSALGKTDEALSLLAGLEETHPGEPRLAVNIANAYMKMGKTEEAERRLRALITAGTDEPLVHFNLGVLLERQGRVEEARTRFEDARRKGLRSPVLLTKLGQLYEKDGNREGALRMYTEAVQADSGFSPALQGLARLRGESGPAQRGGGEP